MAFDITKTREEFDRLHKEAGQYLDTVADRDPTEDEAAAQKTRFSRMEFLKSQIVDSEKLAHLQFTKAQAGEGGTGVTLPAKSEAQTAVENADAAVNDPEKIDRKTFSRALALWAATGVMAAQFATITTATSAGVLLPKQVAAPIANNTMNVFREALAYYGQEPIKTGTTADLVVPVLDGAAGGEVAEDASSETENAPTFSEKINLKPKTYQSGSSWYSNMVLNANDFDLETLLLPQLVANKELGLEKAIIDYIIADVGVGITQTVATATTTGFTYANLVDLNRKLPKRYDRLKVIILSATAYAAAEKMVGEDEHPVLVKDPQNQELLKFNGTPVLRSDYLESLSADNVVGVVISLLGFRLRDVTKSNLARYTQSPSKPDQTGFNLFAYHGWGYAASAVAVLKTPAT